MNNVKRSLILITALCSISQLYPAQAPAAGVTSTPARVIGGNSGKLGAQNKFGGNGHGIDHNVLPPFLGAIEITSASGKTIGEKGHYYPLLKFAYYQSAAGSTTYLLNAQPIITLTPAKQAMIAKGKLTLNPVTIANQKIPLYAYVITPDKAAYIYAGYNKFLHTIPTIIESLSTLQPETITNVQTAFRTLFSLNPLEA